ncbi:hypothetical protein GQ651_17575 [Alphaproteobacteria bacterium GH1-50]|uniref:Uncharacterized protein n=1 Tax=Kangsaoukella pontilimi TaxID=2691042 RepID=A0A7C9N313_9RHOB|nr:inner membrane CreD family protein [Kangsaoukella pontilimi]MXQ09658.1 hypothetical protein [Kangsaoukella pontilimi]
MTSKRPSFGRLFLLLLTIMIAAPFLEPLANHIRERSDAFSALRFDLGQSVGQHPGTFRPELVIPVVGGRGQILLAPAEALVEIDQTRRTVSDGGFEIPYHQSDVSIRMRFEPLEWDSFLSDGETLNWREARIRVRVGMPKILQGHVTLEADGRETRFQKTQTGQHRLEFTARAPRDLAEWSTVRYSVTGWGNFTITPIGWRTQVTLTSELGLEKFQGIQPVSFEQSAFDFSAVYDMDRDLFYERAVRGNEFRRKPKPGEGAFLGMRFGEIKDAPYAQIDTRGADMPYRHVSTAVGYAPQVLALAALLLFLIDWIRGRDSGDNAYAVTVVAGGAGMLAMVFSA